METIVFTLITKMVKGLTLLRKVIKTLSIFNHLIVVRCLAPPQKFSHTFSMSQNGPDMYELFMEQVRNQHYQNMILGMCYLSFLKNK